MTPSHCGSWFLGDRGVKKAALHILLAVLWVAALCQAATSPQVNAVVNAASFSPVCAPGSLISIFGTNFAAQTAQAQNLPLPVELLRLQVTLNDVFLPLLYVSANQINAQLPFDARTGTVRVITSDGSSEVPFTVFDTAPAIFSIASGPTLLPTVVHADGSLVSPSAPAQTGEFVSIYMTGLGQVNGAIEAGQAAPVSPPVFVKSPVEVHIGATVITPSFAGAAPGFVGINQLDIQVPQMSAGVFMLSVTAGGKSSNALPLSISNPTPVQHYEYVFPLGGIYVYDMDNAFKLVKQIPLPLPSAVRGVADSPATHTLYLSYGGDGDFHGNGSMLAFDLLTEKVLWNVDYPTGIDSMAVTPDGKTIYMPTGELSPGNTWNVIDASNGKVIGSISAGTGPHNTVVSLDGTRVYMGPRYSNNLVVASTATNTVIRNIGPLVSSVRPFTINGKQTLAFTTATGFLGFQVSDINTGKVLYTVPVAGFTVPSNTTLTAPSHGISLSPDEKEIWLMDATNSHVHVFDVSGLPGTAPKQVADLPTRSMQGIEDPCDYDCERDGWVQHSRDGRYVFVGNSGDVFDTTTRKVVINLDPLYNTRKHLEIDWQNGLPISTTTRQGMGYVTQ